MINEAAARRDNTEHAGAADYGRSVAIDTAVKML
jgi:hypothetical protein